MTNALQHDGHRAVATSRQYSACPLSWDDGAWLSDPIQIQPGRNYSLGAYERGANDHSMGRLGLRAAESTQPLAIEAASRSGTDWRLMSGTVMIPPDVVAVRIVLSADVSPCTRARARAHFDDVFLVDVGTGPQP